MKKFTYEINGVCYTQTPVVLGQVPQIAKALDGIDAGFDDLPSFIEAMGDKLPGLLAIVLTKDGETLRTKNLTETADELAFNIDLETVEKVVDDFFSCNPITSLLQRIEKGTGAIGGIVGRLTWKILSSSCASSSPEETLPDETPSSGDSAPQK